MIECLPALAVLRAIDRVFAFGTELLVEAYYLKCLGAWSELLFGPKLVLPYECGRGANNVD